MIEVLKGGKRLCRARVANNFFSRFKGLMFQSSLPENEGLLIEYSTHLPSKTVHGFFMRFPIDLIFIDEKKRVAEIGSLQPWKVYNPEKDCKWVLEVNKGFADIKNVSSGDKLSF